MAQNVCITGTGREMALGFHFVLRYLEHGDHVIATVRKPSEALERLKAQYPGALDVLTMDIASTASVEAAAREAARLVPCIDLLINNAVTTSPDCHKELEDANLDYIAGVVDGIVRRGYDGVIDEHVEAGDALCGLFRRRFDGGGACNVHREDVKLVRVLRFQAFQRLGGFAHGCNHMVAVREVTADEAEAKRHFAPGAGDEYVCHKKILRLSVRRAAHMYPIQF